MVRIYFTVNLHVFPWLKSGIATAVTRHRRKGKSGSIKES